MTPPPQPCGSAPCPAPVTTREQVPAPAVPTPGTTVDCSAEVSPCEDAAELGPSPAAPLQRSAAAATDVSGAAAGTGADGSLGTADGSVDEDFIDVVEAGEEGAVLEVNEDALKNRAVGLAGARVGALLMLAVVAGVIAVIAVVTGTGGVQPW